MIFERTEKLCNDANTEAFLGRITHLSDHPNIRAPIRAYLHRSAKNNLEGTNYLKEMKEHLMETLSKNHGTIENADFYLAAIWSIEKDKMIDLFKYTQTGHPDNWPKNPDVNMFVFKNGVYQQNEKLTMRGDTLIMLGAEEHFRRNTKGLTEYIEGRPEIPGLTDY